MEIAEESDAASDGDAGASGDRASCWGNGHSGAPRDGHQGCFLDCVTGPASSQANGGGCGGGWNGCDGLRCLWPPSSGAAFPRRSPLYAFLCWFSWRGSGGGGVWNGVACQRRCGGSAPACFGMIGGVLGSRRRQAGQCLWAARSLPQRFVTLRLARL